MSDALHLVARLPACQHLVDMPHGGVIYGLDCLVRHLLAGAEGPWSRAVALGLGPTAEQLVIQSGIGCLTITPTAVDWRPVQLRSAPLAPPPAPAPEGLRIARLAACRACSRYVDQRCQIAGCGCSGLGNPAAEFSRCPLGVWPSATATSTQ